MSTRKGNYDMPNFLFQSLPVLSRSGQVSILNFIIGVLASVILGILIAKVHMYKNTYTKNFVITLALLPLIIQIVITLVNGNVGTGVAVMGAFSLVRFRSVPGGAKEIGSIFLAMATGLATGMGYVVLAALFLILYGLLSRIYFSSSFGEPTNSMRFLKITIPESLDYLEVFDDLLNHYTKSFDLMTVRTTNMGSLYQLYYQILLKDPAKEKEMMDQLRCRNGNLDITSGRLSSEKAEL